ncbi:uncharacterized protein LOC124372302 [Homalodisca vitripennis]|uniref:uncharacterized protein LOC124372302 n=1 Tax=Homalodisca vitripennis TaxID=197043 RepID=UPI001EEAD011|nr:uncharacterized protein LOC124372302 [Homalodisca vitripennis]
MNSGYWQIPIKEEDKHKTAFIITADGLWEWECTPFGLKTSPAVFQRCMDQVVGPLVHLTRKSVRFHWGPEQEAAFVDLKERLTSAPILRHFDPELPIELHTDASDQGVGAALMQKDGETVLPVAYGSRRLSDAEKKYTTTEKECIAVVWAAQHFRQFLWGRKFTIVVDHHALCWLDKNRDLSGRLGRWALKLMEFDYKIKHKQERLHVVPDCLSRNYGGVDDPEDQDKTNDIPMLAINLKDLTSLQREDPDCKRIIEAVQDPDGAASADRRLAKSFMVEDGLLYKKNVAHKILSDRGTNFTSSLVKELLKGLGIRPVFTTAYHPMCNGLTEHFNGTLAKMLSNYVSTNQRDWDLYVSLTCFSYNTSVQETTRHTPFFLMYGREARLPIDVSLRQHASEDPQVEEVLERVQKCREDVQKIVSGTQKKQKQRFDRTHRHVEFEPGEQVMVWTPIRKKGRSTKLLHRWYGPYQVEAKLSDVNYVILVTKGKKPPFQDTIHVSRLKRYYPRTL